MQVGDFEWIKGRIDDLASKWTAEQARQQRDLRSLKTALERIMKIEGDDKGNHLEVIRSIAWDALRSTEDI